MQNIIVELKTVIHPNHFLTCILTNISTFTAYWLKNHEHTSFMVSKSFYAWCFDSRDSKTQILISFQWGWSIFVGVCPVPRKVYTVLISGCYFSLPQWYFFKVTDNKHVKFYTKYQHQLWMVPKISSILRVLYFRTSKIHWSWLRQYWLPSKAVYKYCLSKINKRAVWWGFFGVLLCCYQNYQQLCYYQ